MNSFIAPDISVFDIAPQIDVELGNGGFVSGVPE